MNLKKPKHLKRFFVCIIGVLVLVSCQSQPCSKAYLPPLPKLEDKYASLEKEPVKYLETLLGNYKKALQWIVIVWETNEGDRR